MYKLTLTKSERDAIDWIGNRYSTGDDFYKLLSNCKQFIIDPETGAPDYDFDDWDCKWDITFEVPEHIAWSIRELFEDEDMLFPCFAPEFVEKLVKFYDEIV